MLAKETWPFYLLVLVLLAGCLLAPVVGGVLWMRRKSPAPFLWCLASWVVAPAILLGIAWIPHDALIDAIRGKPVLVAVYEGTMNHSTLTLRENGHADVFGAAVFRPMYYKGGTYERRGEEFLLWFEGEEPGVPPWRVSFGDGEVSFENYEQLSKLVIERPDRDRLMHYGIVKRDLPDSP